MTWCDEHGCPNSVCGEYRHSKEEAMGWENTKIGARFEGKRTLDDGAMLTVTATTHVCTQGLLHIKWTVSASYECGGGSILVVESGEVERSGLDGWQESAELHTSDAANRCIERLRAARAVGP